MDWQTSIHYVIFLAGYAGKSIGDFSQIWLHGACTSRISTLSLFYAFQHCTLKLKKNFFFHVCQENKHDLEIMYIFFFGYIFFNILFKILINSEWNIHKFYTKFTKSSEHFFLQVPKISSESSCPILSYRLYKKFHANKSTMSANVPDSNRLTWQIFENFPLN